MSHQSTAEEVLDQYCRAMGPELGKQFGRLWNECAWLHHLWHEYVVLFGSKPERIDLLNDAAGAFFRLVQDTFWDATLLQLARLTDPPRSVGKDNLTLERLPGLVHKAIKPETERLVAEIQAKCRFARDWRRRRLAHRDLDLAIGEATIPLAPASRASVRAAIDAIAALLNAIDGHYRDCTTAFQSVRPPRGAEALLYVLRDGLETRDKWKERLASGHLDPDDLRPPRPI